MKTLRLALLLSVAACGGDMSTPMVATKDESSATSVAPDDFAGRGVALESQVRRGGSLGQSAPVFVPNAAPPRPPAQPQSVASNMIIRNGSVRIQVDSIEPAIDRLRALAISLGGVVGGLSIQAGERQVRSATLELKIPAARFDTAMSGMPAMGKVETSQSSAEDVGEEFFDVTARVANAKRLEQRLITLLTTRTGKLEDVLAVERELARVREEIERYEGRIRFLSTRIATSTITATVHEKAPIIAGQPGDNVFVRAFVNLWRNFVMFLTMLIAMLGFIVPIGAIAGVIVFVWRRWRQRVAVPQS